ncbi:MAG: hypothetical protein ABR524_04680 [Thermoanaerobaculia bacterium]
MRFPWNYSKRLVAGAVFGLYMAHLLFFLNPQIEINPTRLITVTVLYAILCGLIFGSLLWGFRALRVRIFGRPGEDGDGAYHPHGFGFVVSSAFLSGLVYWIHLGLLRIYLPRGAVRILSKATIVIGVTAVLLFILWLFEKNAGRKLSRILYTAGAGLILLSLFFLYVRREGYRHDLRPPVASNVTIGQTRPVSLVAIRDLPYDWVVTIRGEGGLTFLSAMADEGLLARVEPFRTTSPKAIWASLNTGKLPYRHGVTGRFSYRTPLNRPGEAFLLVPMGVGFKGWGLIPPVERISAQLPSGNAAPFWRVFERMGYSAEVRGWRSGGSPDQEVDLDGFAGFEEFERSVTSLAPRVAESLIAAVRADAGRMRSTESSGAGLTAIDLESLDRAIALLEIEGNQLPERHTREGEIIRGLLALLDREIERFHRNMATPGILVVVSPSAPEPPVLPGTIPGLFRALGEAQDPGAGDGLLILSGGGVISRNLFSEVEVVDVVPTLLFAAGLPIARDMDGRIITEAFTDEFVRTNPISMIQSYEDPAELRPSDEPTRNHG